MDLTYIIIMFAFVLIEFITLKMGGWLLPFITGMFGMAFSAAALSHISDIPFYPYPILFLAVISSMVMLNSVLITRNQ